MAILIFFHIFRDSFLKKNLDNDWSISLKILKIPWAFENPVGFWKSRPVPSRHGTGRDGTGHGIVPTLLLWRENYIKASDLNYLFNKAHVFY